MSLLVFMAERSGRLEPRQWLSSSGLSFGEFGALGLGFLTYQDDLNKRSRLGLGALS